MKFEIVGSPEGENTREGFTFSFRPASLDLILVEARRYVRADEYTDWREIASWHYPDLANTSTMEQPDCPGWAVNDAKQYILHQLQFKQ